MTTRIALVVQRYGKDIVGGAELHARQLAERLHASLGWEVDIYTTTARDYRTWANELPSGQDELNGVRILRFHTLMPRAPCFAAYDRLSAPLMRLFRRGRLTRPLCRLLERVWILLQGPYVPGLVKALVENEAQYRKILFMTYLYYPTIAGLPRLADKSVPIPLAHDEHPFHFLTNERLLRAAPEILANTVPELESLILPKLGPAAATKWIEVAGAGFDETALVPGTSKSARDHPYLLYLGRICAGKGVPQLIDWFRRYRARRAPAGLRLLLAGHVEDSVRIPDDPAITYLGYVDEERKLTLLRNATALVNPSPHESLSMTVIEAMAMKLPALVNRNCKVLRYYTEQTRTVLGFADEASFHTALDQVLAKSWQEPAHDKALEETRRWALARFSWSQVLAVFERHVTSSAQRV